MLIYDNWGTNRMMELEKLWLTLYLIDRSMTAGLSHAVIFTWWDPTISLPVNSQILKIRNNILQYNSHDLNYGAGTLQQPELFTSLFYLIIFKKIHMRIKGTLPGILIICSRFYLQTVIEHTTDQRFRELERWAEHEYHNRYI